METKASNMVDEKLIQRLQFPGKCNCKQLNIFTANTDNFERTEFLILCNFLTIE